MSEGALLDDLRSALGPDCIRAGTAVEPRHLGDWMVRPGPEAAPAALALPRSTADVAAVLKVCRRHRVPVVPQGGLTGLTGGGAPIAGAVLVSLERMRAIEHIDPTAGTMRVEAGVPLATIQEAADAAGLLFPLDIGARGSCLIGGNISTNAGGNRVLRYGMTRELVLGLEVVLADGTIVTSLNTLLKNNAGYDVKHLFIGTEGTLGIVTRAVLRLFPKPLGSATALCAFADFDSVYAFLRRARTELGATLSAFELMWPAFYAHATAGASNPPLSGDYAAYVLVESMGTDPEGDATRFRQVIEGAMTDGVLVDGVVAKSVAEARALWAIRDMSGELVRRLSPVANFDVSIETGAIGAFVAACEARLRERWPSAATICFGHLADSNLHMFITADDRPFPEHEIDALVYDCVRDWHGSISAEHGIGLLKKPYLAHSRTPEEIAVMKVLKAALDPQGLLNPGKIFD